MSKRENEKQLNYWMPIELYKKIRVAAAEECLSMKEYICKTLERHFEQKEGK